MKNASILFTASLLGLITGAPGLDAQTLMVGEGTGGEVVLGQADLAFLEMQEPRRDLPCVVSPIKPFLGFDMRFHAGYDVMVPIEESAYGVRELRVLFRVTPREGEHGPYYFRDVIPVPAISERTGGQARLQGGFDVGEGKYHVDWLMQDNRGRVCSNYWDAEAFLSGGDKEIALAISQNRVEQVRTEEFQEEAPVVRQPAGKLLHVKLLIHFAPQDDTSSALLPIDTAPLVSLVRALSRDPRIGEFSVVAFNLRKQRELYRAEAAPRIDFPALGRALETLNVGTISLNTLMEENPETAFLENLLKKELNAERQPDALVFIGPKAMLDENVSKDLLAQLGPPNYPVFYLNYNLVPTRNPWRDAIGQVVRFFKGQEYLISRPRDVFFAVKDTVSRMALSRHD